MDIVTILVEAGADVNARDADDNPLLHMAIEWEYSNRYHRVTGNVEIVTILVEAGADVNARDAVHGKTLLQDAISMELSDIAQILVDNGAR